MTQTKAKWGFDLTSFGEGEAGAKVFKSILDEMGLNCKPKRRRSYKYLVRNGTDKTPLNERPFIWSIKGLRLVTGANPLTGEYYMARGRESELGYASYIGISGDRELVEKLAKLISSKAEFVKEETPNESGFIN